MDHERTVDVFGPDRLEGTTRLSEETEPMALGVGEAPELPRGTSLDRYVVLDKLGAGGMGVVYLAYDPELDRRVAIKVLLPAQVGEGRPRLVREAQAIARIAHPNVVAVHDVGEFEGSVFVAMEFVEGQTLGHWLRTETRPIPEILGIFAQAGRGLAAAHAADLIHRDFKPENVLLGNDGRVRVADFGLARGRGSDESIGPAASMSNSNLDEALTEAGAVMGTPAYMSPEQLAGQLATAASDQFAFCVALYEALYGERPFQGKSLESLSTAVFRGQVREPAEGRSVPSWLRRVLLRGLATAPADRHPTMEALLRALERDPTVARRRWALASVVGLAAMGAAVLAYPEPPEPVVSPCATTGDDLRAVWNDERRRGLASAFAGTSLPYATDTWTRVETQVDRYAASWSAQSQEACEATHVEQRQSPEDLEHRRRCLGERLHRLDAFLEVLARADATAIDRAVQSVRGLPDLEACRDLEALQAGIAPPEQEATRREVEALREELTRAEALGSAARYDEELELLDDLMARARATGYLPIIAAVEHSLARTQQSLGRPEGMQTLRTAFRDALAASDDRRAAMAAVDLAFALGYEQRLHEEGREWLGIAQALLHRMGGAPRVEIGLLNAEAIIEVRQAHYDNATKLFEQLVEKQRAFDPEDPNLAVALMNLGSCHAERRDFGPAQKYLQEAVEHTERTLGPQHPSMTTLWANLALIAVLEGNYEDAEAKLERTLELQRSVLGENHLEVARSLASMAVVKRNLGDPAQAETLHREALAIRRAKLGPDHPAVAESLRNLAHAVWDRGRTEEAIDLARQAQQTAAHRLAEDHPEHGLNAAFLAALLEDAGHHREARAEADRAIRILEEHSPDPTAPLEARITKAEAERALGRVEAAVDLLEAALDLGRRHDAKNSVMARIRFELAMSLDRLGRTPDRVHRLVTKAKELVPEGSRANRELRERIDAWLAEHPPEPAPRSPPP